MLRPTLLFGVGLLATTIFILWVPTLVSFDNSDEGSILSSSSWIVRLLVNLIGYASILVPGYLLLHFFRKHRVDENDAAVPHFVTSLIQLCVFGRESEKSKLNDIRSSHDGGSQAKVGDRSTSQEAWTMLICFVGLQGSYLTWGVLQEKIMTRAYVSANGTVDEFKDSQFLVFVNRILAFILSGTYILLTSQPTHTAPLYKYSYCSFSNILSSWCQYEALKYVSFPTQVLAKASKIIPVMIMGKIVSRKTYEYYEYSTAVAISLGMGMFLLGSVEEHSKTTVTTFSGIVILIGYMTFDSFTSNWQSELFTQHKMSSVQMMCGVNLFSCLFTTVSLVQQGSFVTSIQFMFMFPKFVLDIIMLSLCSALGQLFIYLTIAQFGAVVFVIIMTIRQGLAILLSCIIYKHPVSAIGIVGILLVFMAMFLRIYCSHRLKQLRRQSLYISSDANKV